MSKEFDDLVAQVAANTSVETSAITLIQGLADKLADNPTADEVAALSSQLKISADSLAAAVAANTESSPL